MIGMILDGVLSLLNNMIRKVFLQLYYQNLSLMW